MQVSSKLRAAYETDLQAMAPQSMMFPGLHPAAMMSTVGLGNQQTYRPTGFQAPASRTQNPPQIPNETSYLYIPNAAVGAVIGRLRYKIRMVAIITFLLFFYPCSALVRSDVSPSPHVQRIVLISHT